MAEIGSLSVSLSMDASNFNGSISQVDRNLRAMSSELKAVRARGTEYGNSLDGLRSRQDVLRRSLDAANIKLTETRRRYDEMVASGTASEAQLQRQARRVNEAQAQYNRLEAELNDVDAALRRQSSSWQQLSDRLAPIGARLTSLGQSMTNLGRDLSMKVTAPLVALGVGAFKSAMDFESAFAGVRKTVDATEEEFAKLEKGIRDMAKAGPTSANELASIAEAAGQLGIETENILTFTNTMSDLATSTNMSSEQAATSLARLANITQMPQTQFDQLGSAIVALGNNLATTESEITEFGLRIAGAGAQVGLSEAQILSIGAALSSVGINAEAGGTAISKVMIELANAVATGGKDLNKFAKVAGMTSADFKKAFEKDAATAIVAFIEGLDRISVSGENVFAVIEDLGLKEVRVRDALLRASGAGDLLRESLDLGTKAWEENIALTNEASERYKTTESQLLTLKNQIVDIGISLGEVLIPKVLELVDKLKPIIDRFANMSSESQNLVLAIGGIVAAIGPLLVVGGTLMAGLGGLVTTISTVSGAIAGAGGLSAALGGLAAAGGPITIAIAGIAGLVTGGIALYKNWDKLTQGSIALEAALVVLTGPVGAIVKGIKTFQEVTSDAIPEIDRFGEGVSEATQEALNGFFALSDGASQKIMELSLTQRAVTEETKIALVEQYSQMNEQILMGMQERHATQLESMQTYFANSTALTSVEEQKILQIQQMRNDTEVANQRHKEEKIKEILETAAAEKRTLTETEKTTINILQQQMNENAVKYLSENEVESKVILERMKQQAGDLTARQAAEVVANSNKQKSEAIKAAEEQYDKTIAEIIRMRDESGVITADQADRMIREATRQRDETVKHAEDMHGKVVAEAKSQAEEHIKHVDWETGEVLKKWDVFKNDLSAKYNEIKNNTFKYLKEIKDDTVAQWETMKSVTSNKIEEMKESVNTNMEKVKTTISTMWNEAKTFLENIDLVQIGRDIINGLISGISEKMSSVRTKIEELASKLPQWMRDMLQIKSPSVVFKTISHFMMDGLILGVDEKIPEIEGAMDKVVEAVTNKASAFVKAAVNLGKSFSNSLNSSLSYSNDYVASTALPGSSSNTLVKGDDGKYYTWEDYNEKFQSGSKSSGSSSTKTVADTVKDTVDKVKDTVNKIKDKLKFHDGGWVGSLGAVGGLFSDLRSDEVPAILQMGEFVMSRKMIDDIERMDSRVGAYATSSATDNSRTINQYITINSPQPMSASESARKYKQASRQLAMEW